MTKLRAWKYFSVVMVFMLVLGLAGALIPTDFVRADTVVTFPDANLEAAIRDALGKPAGDIYASELTGLTNLSADGRKIVNLSGLEYCTSLQSLGLGNNQISDLTPLAGLTSLTGLYLYNNRISNLTPVAGLTSLTQLELGNNQISGLTSLAGLTSLTGLNLYNNHISDVSPLAGLTSLNGLNLNSNQISDLTPLAGLGSLQWLNLGSNQISNLTPLTGFPTLNQLYLYNNQISDLTPLVGLPTLSELNLNSNLISDLTPLAGLLTLGRLYLYNNKISDMSPLAGLPNLTGLDLGNNQISNWAPLAGMTNLTWLGLGSNQINDLSTLAVLTNLTGLELSSNQISDLTPLAGLTSLTGLNLNSNQISNLTPLVGLTKLSYLNLDNNQIGNLVPLAGLSSLSQLYLGSNQISDMTPLAGLTNLTGLNLGSNQISNWAPLAGLTSLTGLYLYNNQISDMTPLAGLTNLNSLSLYNNQISNLAPLAGLSSLTQLNLGANQISNISPLAGLSSLNQLYLYNNQISDLSPLAGLTNLNYLYLNNNQIGDVAPLAGLSNLSQLNLNSNQISNLTPLAGLTSLNQLLLYNNQISNLTPLAGLTSLTGLYLSSNQISDLSPLAGLTSLTGLYLSSNQISDLTPLAGLTSLRWLDLSSNQISDLLPLVNNTGLATGDMVWLSGNVLSQTSANVHIPALQARGVIVFWDGCVVVTFPDANLEAAVREALNKPVGDINSSELAGLWSLNASSRGIIDLTGLEYCTGLNQLDLRDNQINDLASLAGLTNLTQLYLQNNQISDIAPLVDNSGLATGDTVWLSSNPLSQTSITVHIPALQARGVMVAWDDPVVVTFPDANLEAAIRQAVNKPVGDIHSSELAGLTDLWAGGRGIVNLSGLEYCTNLQWLNLNNNQISNLTPVAGLTTLTWLELSSNQISNLSPLAGLASLQGLGLSSNQISNLTPLTGLTNLTWLELSSNHISDLTPLAGLTSLQWLGLSSNQISDLTPLAGLTNLTWLELSSNQISNLSPLAGLASLQGLGLSSNQISNLIPLAGLTNLYQLNLDNNQISNLSPLAGLTSLQWLTLSSNQISDVSPLAGLTSLQWLELSSNQISDLTPLAGLISLNDLFLYNNQISDLTPLTGLTNLNWLDVNNNQISDIKPLVDNAGLWYGDYVYLQGNPLSQTSIDEYIPALRAKGVKVFWDNQPPSPAPGPIQPETTQWQTLNTPAVGNEILSPSEVNKIAVAADGATIWAVDTPAKAIRKSYHRGWTWSEAPNSALHSAMTAAGISQDNQFIWDVVLAPDNSNMVAVVTGSASSPDPTEVWMSTNGGTMWVCADFSAVSGGAIIGAVDISRDYGTGRDIAVGARDGVPGAFRLWVLQTPGSNPWKLQTMVPAANADIVALKFSPNYLADASLGVVYCTDSATYYNIALRDRDPAANDIVNWVYVTPGIEVRNQDSPPDASPEATTIVNADLELPRDFDGQNAGLRRAYISTNSLGAGTKATTARDGIFRIDDTTVYTLMDTSQIPAKSICSLAYSGTYASGKLLAGEALGYPCSATVPTWFTDSPTECPIPCWYPALKPPTGAAAQGTCSQVSKNGFGNAQVAWSPDYGAVAYCGTSSADFRNGGVNTSPGSGCWPAALRTTIALDESAFSVTRNNGETWNQLGMIDTRIDKLTDVAPSADSSTIYLASINDTDVAGGGCTGFDSVWRTSSNLDVTSPFPLTPIGACWERVLTRITSENCTAPQTNQALLRVVPYGADPTGEIVAWGAYDPSSSLAHGVAAWSPDHGDYWQNIPVRHPVQDFCFESRTILYFLNPGGLVQKMPYTGTTWSTALPDVSTGLGSGNSIAAIPTGNVLVGGGTSSSFPVAYSANGAQSFTAITEPLDPATVLVAFDAGFSSNGTIYAATREANSGGTIYRNTLPSPGQWTNLKPLQLGYYGLVTGSKGPLYAANPLFVERTLNPDTGIPGDIGEWDVLISNLLDFPIRIGLQPNSLKLSDQTGQAAILYFVEDHEYAPESNAGGLWTYADCLAGTGPQLIETMPIVCDPTLHMPPVFSLSWMPSCFEKFYELQVADTDNFTAGSWRHLWYQPPDASSPSLLIPPGGMPVTSENTPGWVGTLSDSISNILGVSPDMQVIGLEPTISVPSLQPECGHTYYWRIRAVGSTQGDIIRSPWSETESFTISNALPSAASVNSATGTGVVTFSSDIGTITDLTAVAEGTLPIAGKPAGIIFPHGLFSFRIIGIPPGATATVTITFPSSLPEGTQYWKYQSGIGWYQIPIVSHVANVIVIRLTDGGLGDADMVINQIIVDPGGSGLMPGVVAAIPALSTTPTTTQSPRSSSPPPQTLWLPPADVRLHTLSVSPGQAQIGQPVTVLANVVNNGGSSGSYDVILRINGKMEQQRIIEVSPGTAYPVKFIVTKSQPGTYTVNIGDKKGSFIILGSGRPVRDMREGPALVAAMVVIVLLFCLVILIARRRIQGY